MTEFARSGPWETQLIYMGKAGSAAYGTMTPESDTDLRGVFLAEQNQLIGLGNSEPYTEEKPIDLQCYELRHFARLCLNGSPLQVEMLWYPDECWTATSPAWDKLRNIKYSFLGKHLKKTLGGFTQGDIKRIQGNSMAKCGAKGKILVEKYGYNTKHASNAYRLLKMSELLWTTGDLVVRLPEKERNEIIAIKKGKYTRDEFLKYIADEDKRVFDLADNANLPDCPNQLLVEKTVMDIYRSYLKDKWNERTNTKESHH
jgi:hypothetical protein